ATTISPSRWTACGDRGPRRSLNWRAMCGAAGAPEAGAIRASAAIWVRCVRPRSRRATRPLRGGRGSGRDCPMASDFISEDDLDTFEGWMRYQAFDRASATPEEVAAFRQL